MKRRKRVDFAVQAGWVLASAIAVAVLAIVTGSVLVRGVPALNGDLFTRTPVTFGETGGGIAHAFVGSLVLVGIGAAMALPVGVLSAIYVSELADRRVARVVTISLDVLNGLPSIVIGIFLFALLVVGRGQNAFIGSLALAIIMLPLISRSTQEVLALVPSHLREGSLALGVSRWRTIVGVILPTTVSGILTATTLAVARAAGETAPLLFTTSLFGNDVSGDVGHALASVPVVIFTYSEAPDPHLNDEAWAAAFVLIVFVLVTSLLSRALLARSRRKLERG
ncbi:MAG TPA: phosphate ABC transporter permease PstA [Gaiellaceae bacterium]|nr:phosphate ABC transporter permease PstA [Gaiellaceae bacterium]